MRLVPPALGLVLALALPLTAVPAEAAAARCEGLRATIVGNAQANTITGTAGRDVISAGDGNDRVRGLGGNDVICGGFGSDRLVGGAGNDRLFGEEDAYGPDAFGRIAKRGDILVGEAGNDHIDPGYDIRPTTPGAVVALDGVSYATAPGPVVVSLTSNPASVGADGSDVLVTGGPLRLVGSEHADTMSGTFRQEWFYARGGDDRVYGQGGDDVLVGDAGAAAGNDLLSGGSGDDELTGSVGADTFVGSTGEDTMSSTSVSRQVFRGGGGSDSVTFPLPLEPGFVAKGYGGADRLRLLAHPNPALKLTVRIDQQKARSTIRGLTATTVTGKITGFSDVFLPGQATSVYKGTGGSDIVTAHPDYRAMIYGRGGPDVLTGSGEPDRLDGGAGLDLVRGKGGNDTCRNAERRSSC